VSRTRLPLRHGLRWALVLAALGAAPSASAAESTVRAEVDARKVGVEDQVQLDLVVEGDTNLAEEVALPPLQGLRVAGGPSVSTQMSFVNGVTSQRRVYTWVLRPAAVGTAEIGAFEVKLASGRKTTAPIALEIVAGSIRPAQRRRASALDPFGADPFGGLLGGRGANRPAPKVLVKALASRDRVHVGEPVLVTYYVYTQTSITDLRAGDAPQYPGFWSEDLPQPEGGPRGEPATLDGERFERFPFLRKVLFPTRAGSLTIPPATFHVGVAPRGFFDAGDRSVTRTSDAVTVTVLPIPEEPGFAGAVGKFRATATLDKADVALGEAATLRFRVEGSGNLKWIDKAPELSVPGAKVYPPSTSSDLKTGPAGIAGSKTWEFAIVPETGGRLEVPALGFAYFDPAAGRIVRSETAPLALSVRGAAASSAPAFVPSAPSRAPGQLALRAELDQAVSRLSPAPRTVAIALLAALAFHAALFVGPGLADRLRAARGRPAPRRTTRAALGEIERIGRDGPGKEAAAAALERALHEVFGPLENGSGSLPDERERAARAVLEEVRFLRYAPQLGDYSDQIREVAARAAEVVRRWA
jgi:hypothetical protein